MLSLIVDFKNMNLRIFIMRLCIEKQISNNKKLFHESFYKLYKIFNTI